jgi:Na+-transporting methylmalonyl-CoA/oxaloacetate decarboxylase gamma subunit
MSSDLIKALEISGIGMGLVFLGILVLWGMMALLVKLTNNPNELIDESEDGE